MEGFLNASIRAGNDDVDTVGNNKNGRTFSQLNNL